MAGVAGDERRRAVVTALVVLAYVLMLGVILTPFRAASDADDWAERLHERSAS